VTVRGNSANVGAGVRLERRADAPEAFVTSGVTIEDNVGEDLSVRELDAR
jgi:hypothetical protein